MLFAVAGWLAQRQPGLPPISVDFLPESPDACIGLFVWDRTASVPYDGTSTRHVQVRVRSPDYETASSKCQAVTALLDSGFDEAPIGINWPGAVIGRIKRGPILYEREASRVTVYSEIALWGAD